MKRKLLLTVCALVCTNVAFAQRPDNYKPDNPNVTLTQTNLPIVFIDVAGKQIDRKEKITAKVKIIIAPGTIHNIEAVDDGVWEVGTQGEFLTPSSTQKSANRLRRLRSAEVQG